MTAFAGRVAAGSSIQRLQQQWRENYIFSHATRRDSSSRTPKPTECRLGYLCVSPPILNIPLAPPGMLFTTPFSSTAASCADGWLQFNMLFSCYNLPRILLLSRRLPLAKQRQEPRGVDESRRHDGHCVPVVHRHTADSERRLQPCFSCFPRRKPGGWLGRWIQMRMVSSVVGWRCIPLEPDTSLAKGKDKRIHTYVFDYRLEL